MGQILSVSQAARSKLKRLDFLPRFSLTVELAGRRVTYRQAPLLETLVNLKDRGLSWKNLKAVYRDQLSEIIAVTPVPAAAKKPLKAVRPEGATAVKKPQPKAAAKKKAPVKPAQKPIVRAVEPLVEA